MNSLDQVADAATVLAALRDNRQQASERFGRQVGVSRARAFLVRGAGTIVAIDNKGVSVSLTGAGPPPNIVLQTSLLFGNTVRDASGLLNPGDFSNSQHFNAISSELNRIVETRLLPRLKEQAEPGRTIQFVACAQVMPDQAGITPLRMIPLRIAIE
jgi:predicted lipoprotein